MTKNYLIAYDIPSKKRLSKIRKVAYSYALGGQKSVVEAPLSPKSLREVVQKLNKLVKKSDKINIIEFEGEPICFGRANFLAFDDGVLVI